MFEIRMINTNFDVGFQINREKLYHLLMGNDELDVFYDPIIHACVNIKYTIKNIINDTIFCIAEKLTAKKQHKIERWIAENTCEWQACRRTTS